MPFLQFKGKTAVESYHYSVPHHTLEFNARLSLLAPGQTPTLDDNLIIEGDNLRALKALLPTHAGRIKCIYIDPPYNTGEEGWVYNDNLNQPQFKEWIGETVGKEGEDASRHDKWCCMMLPRLHLLRLLLRPDGVIFVSLDDNEIGNLRVMMDEVFGSENFIASIVWQKRTSPDARKPLGAAHDYIVVYAMSPDHRLNPVPFNTEDAHEFRNPDHDPKGPWASTDLTGQTGHATASQYYEITTPSGVKYGPPDGRCWALAESTFLKMADEERIWFGKNGDARPRQKRYLADVEGTSTWTWWSNVEVGHNQEATKNLSDTLGRGDAFDNPKPVRLIKRIIQIATDDDDIILDSFAGSGTTAQAITELNQENESNRKFILVQQKYDTKENEKEKVNICETITQERVRRVMQGYSYVGTQTETLMEEKVGLNTLKKADELLKRIETAREQGRANFDDARAEMKDGVVRVEGVKKITEKTEGLGGTFAYACVSEHPLFGEYRDLGEHLPSWENLAAYIFYTETSHQFDRQAADPATGNIGAFGGSSYYLLYTPDDEAGKGLGIGFLKTIAAHDPNKNLVVYSEKFVMHRDTLHKWEIENHKKVRSMLVPFNLR